ncbi:MAG: hypothetical protein FJ241_05390 [Nitrospira sp.]|nr:hypothetical protein [Nitrospira sp.]
MMTACEKYLDLLEFLSKKKVFGRLSVYPAIGVDGLVALFAERVIGLNWEPYDIEGILNHLSPILPSDLISKLRTRLEKNLTYIARIDASRLDLISQELEPYRNISPKSLILKGLFENIFLREWDIDLERFYNVPLSHAEIIAKDWIREIINWLNIGDNIINFDRNLIPFLTEQDVLREKDLGIQDLGADFDTTYTVNNVPIVLLPQFVRVFERM